MRAKGTKLKTHRWPEIKAEWLAGKHKTLDALAIAHGVRPSYLRVKAGKEGWSERRAQVEQEIERRVVEQTIVSETARLTEAKERHLRIGKMMQVKGFERLRDATLFSESNALIALRNGVSIEREALGMEEKAQVGVEVSQTVNLGVVLLPADMSSEAWQAKFSQKVVSGDGGDGSSNR